MTEHEAIYHQAAIDTLESVLEICDAFVEVREERMARMARETPDRDYLTERYNEGALDMANEIRARIREELEDERAYDDERRAEYEDEEE